MAPKGDCDAPPASQGQYAAPTRDDDPSLLRDDGDALPLREGWYAMPATPGRDDKTAAKSPISESASTVRKVPLQQSHLGPQQIESLMKSQHGKKGGKLSASFTSVLEQEREETPMPTETPPSVGSHNSDSYTLFPCLNRHTQAGAVSSDSMLYTSTPAASELEGLTTNRASNALPSSQSRMASIRAIAEDVHNRSGKDDNLLGALQVMLDKEQLKIAFPQ